jgi:hypothetical protein
VLIKTFLFFSPAKTMSYLVEARSLTALYDVISECIGDMMGGICTLLFHLQSKLLYVFFPIAAVLCVCVNAIHCVS